MRLVVVLLALTASAPAFAGWCGYCYAPGVDEWSGPRRETRKAAQRDVDAHKRKHPRHKPKVVKCVPDTLDGPLMRRATPGH